MDKSSLIISGLISVSMVIMFAPRILASNKGRVLRNIAIWVAIFLCLALIYKHFGPYKTALDAPVVGAIEETYNADKQAMENDGTEEAAPLLDDSDSDLDDDSYMPPSEEN